MAVTSPPLFIPELPKPEDPFDTSSYKAYLESGSRVKYVVWPALLLYKEGPILTKGVAQGGECASLTNGTVEQSRNGYESEQSQNESNC